MQVTETIYKRRSIRNFKKSNISINIIEQIIEAGIYAPSAKNRQPWFFYVLHDERTKNEFIQQFNIGINKLMQKYKHQNIPRPDIEGAMSTAKIMEQASAIILVTCRKKYSKIYEDNVNWYLHALDIEVTDILSIGAAIQNMLLKATDLGYGSLWVCDIFYAYQELVDFIQTEDAIVSAVCIGQTEEQPEKGFRHPVEDVSLFYKNEESDS